MRQVKIPGGNSLSFSHLPNKYHWFKVQQRSNSLQDFYRGNTDFQTWRNLLVPAREGVKTIVHNTHPSFNGDMLVSDVTSWSSISQSHIAGNTYIYEVQFHTLAAGIPLYRKHRGVIPTSLAKNIAPYSSNSTTLKKKS